MEKNCKEAESKTAVIIGGGPAGLTAAYMLLKETNIHPIVLEESSFLGGISRTVVYQDNRMDIGGHRFFTKDPRVMEIWRSLMPLQGAPALDDAMLGTQKNFSADGPDPETEERVMLLRNRVSRIFFLRKFFEYPIAIKPETFRNMGFARTVQAGFGYLWSALRKREERSLEDFYINRFGKPLYQMFFEDYTEKLWGVHPAHISPDWGAQRVKGLSLSKAVAEFIKKSLHKGYQSRETSLIEQFFYPKKGPGQLWETMAEEILRMGGEIRMNHRVSGFSMESNAIKGVRVVREDGTDETVCGQFFLSSMPVKDLVSSLGDSPPQRVREVARALPYRDFITVGLLAKKLKITNQTSTPTVGGIVPDCWIYIQERDVKIGRLQIFNNWSPYMVKDLEHTVWMGLEYFCGEGDALWSLNKDDFIRSAIAELAKMGIVDPADVLDATHLRVKKAYPAYFGAYSEFSKVREYLDGLENLFCIGRNGQHRYNNMDHSMLTAMEAVRLIRQGSPDKTSLWNVNTEGAYHEQSS